jgi:predicted metal-dependent hydrolase
MRVAWTGPSGAAGTLRAMPTPQPASRPEPRPGRIRQGDREKAYRPLSEAARRVAFEAGLAAYARGEHFEAHELLEPAWMGTDDLAERALHQGLIKVAAAYVHAGRGNPPGILKNLAGARRHLALAGPVAEAWGVDVVALLADVDARLADPSLAATAPAPVIRRASHP